MAFAKYVTFSYDDGGPQDERLVNIFNRYGMKCTFNINSGFMPEEYKEGDRISKDRARDVYKGHEVASHGKYHPKYAHLTREESEADISEDIAELEKIMGYRIRGHAYPYSSYNGDTVEILRNHGIEYARIVGGTEWSADISNPFELCPTCHHSYGKIFEILEKFRNAEPVDGDILLYIWGHSYEFDHEDYLNSWEHIETVSKTLAGMKDVTPVTNIEYFDILKKRGK